jgi:hypothetical protein
MSAGNGSNFTKERRVNVAFFVPATKKKVLLAWASLLSKTHLKFFDLAKI